MHRSCLAAVFAWLRHCLDTWLLFQLIDRSLFLSSSHLHVKQQRYYALLFPPWDLIHVLSAYYDFLYFLIAAAAIKSMHLLSALHVACCLILVDLLETCVSNWYLISYILHALHETVARTVLLAADLIGDPPPGRFDYWKVLAWLAGFWTIRACT